MAVNVVDINLDACAHGSLNIDALHVDCAAIGINIILRHAVDGLEVNPVLAEYLNGVLITNLHHQVIGQTAATEKWEDVETIRWSHQHGGLSCLRLSLRQSLHHSVEQLCVFLYVTRNLNFSMMPISILDYRLDLRHVAKVDTFFQYLCFDGCETTCSQLAISCGKVPRLVWTDVTILCYKIC